MNFVFVTQPKIIIWYLGMYPITNNIEGTVPYKFKHQSHSEIRLLLCSYNTSMYVHIILLRGCYLQTNPNICLNGFFCTIDLIFRAFCSSNDTTVLFKRSFASSSSSSFLVCLCKHIIFQPLTRFRMLGNWMKHSNLQFYVAT